MEIKISAGRVIRLLSIALAVLFIGSLCVQVVGHTTGRWRLGGITNLFNLDGDQTVPTWFSSILLLLSSLVAWTISRISAPGPASQRTRWSFLGFVFLVMSIDEVATIHESVGSFLGKALHTKGYLYFAFVIPGVLLAVGLFLAYLPFLRSLPRRTGWGLFAAGVLYVFGAAGLEAMSANSFYTRGAYHLEYRLLTNFEELFEIAGLILVLKVLLSYLLSFGRGAGTEIRLRLGP